MSLRPLLRSALRLGALLLVTAWTAPGGENPAVVKGTPAASRLSAKTLLDDVTQGALRAVQEDGTVVECPLKHTDVKAVVSGFIARVKVTQTFHNPLDEKIEAVYVFPLPHEAGVDEMTMVIGQKRIVGVIQKREEARKTYEKALAAGKTAALLEQERPNIFTQSVGNIAPKQEVQIEISYVDVLTYDQGVYEFHFPMVVGPRYIPGSPVSKKPPVPPELQGQVAEVRTAEGPNAPRGTGWSPDTTAVPDASRITPPVLKPGVRNGHDIALSVRLEAGVPIQDLKVLHHQAEVQRDGAHEGTVTLSPADSIPNKDFVLRYGVVGAQPELALLCHTRAAGQGYFMLMVQPKEDEKLKAAPPREIVFLMDVSGSMRGLPNAKCREAIGKALGLCREQDTVQVITFFNLAEKLFEQPVPCTKENIGKALAFSGEPRGSGGTEMLKGVRLAINDPRDKERVRIVVMLTDGYIGNEAQIIEEVGRSCGAELRFCVLGIGNSVNRFLVDGVARQGGGLGKVVGLNEDPTPVVTEMMTRLQRAQLANVKADWGGIEVCEVLPARIPDLWAGSPIILFGMYKNGKKVTLSLSGDVEGQPVRWPLEVEYPAAAKENDVLATVWARRKIEGLMSQDRYQNSPAVTEQVTNLALDYRLVTSYTSFVAVEEKEEPPAEPGQAPRRLLVPVPMPEGVSFEGVFGKTLEDVIGVGGGWGGGNGTGYGPDNGAGSGSFGQRNGGGRRLMVLRHGGSRGTESGVDRALAWLAKHQEADGHWDAKKCGSNEKTDTACTGLALLAFLGAGHTEKVGQYKDNVKRAVAWLKSKQDADGLIFDTTDAGGPRGIGYPHAIAGLALAEAAGMAKIPDTVAAAQKAIDYSVQKHQNGDGNEKRGFRYNPRQDGDLSVTGWFVMQLKSAKVAGLAVDHGAFEGAIKFLDSVERKGARGDKENRPASVYQYRPDDPREESAHRLTAIGNLCRQFLGWKKEDLEASVQWFMEKGGPPDGWGKEKTDLYYWYYGTLCAFQQGGEVWKKWNDALKKTLCDNQRKDGDEDGSWDPVGQFAADWGRVGQTALCCLCLEVYYRYLPLYK